MIAYKHIAYLTYGKSDKKCQTYLKSDTPCAIAPYMQAVVISTLFVLCDQYNIWIFK